MPEKSFLKSKFKTHLLTAVLFGTLIVTGFCSQINNADAQSAVNSAINSSAVEDLQKKIDERNRNIEQLNAEIKQYAELADKTSQEAKTLQSLIKNLEANAKALNLDIKKTSAKIDIANLDIKKISINIKGSEEKITTLKDGIASSINEISRNEDTSIVENLLNQKSFSDLLIGIDSQLNFNNAIQTKVVQLQQEKQNLEKNKGEQENKKKELVDLKTELSDKKKVVDNTKTERNQVLKDTKNQEKNYQQMVADRQAKKAALEKEIFDYESQLKYTLDPSSIPKSGSSAWAWPVDKVIITQKFGKTSASKRLYVSGTHNGVDFGVPLGTKVKAMGVGTVIGTGDTDVTCKGASFGRWILIRYDNGLAATYGHLSVISVSKGQQVMTGDTVGYSGSTGYSTGPHLHISAYAADAVQVQDRPSATCGGRTYTMPIAPVDAYLDPMLYFPSL